MYTSHIAVVEFEESILVSLQNVSYDSIVGDECTDITTVEELSGKWLASGVHLRYHTSKEG